MSKCGVCHKSRRTGTGQQARLLTETGDLRTVIACATCAKRGALVIAPAPPTFTTIESDDADVVKVLRALAKQFRGYGDAYARTCEVAGETSITTLTWHQAADIAVAWANERAARKVDTVPEQKSHTR